MKLMRKVEWDEWYPVYVLTERYGRFEIELTDDEVADYERVMDEFNAWQQRFSECRHAATRRTA